MFLRTFSALLLIAGTLLLVGCQSSDGPSAISFESDFTPPTGAERGWENDGPYEQRLLLATSKNGMEWERTGQIVSDQANTPNMLVSPEGTIFLYYTGSNIAGKDQTMAAAVSYDNGETWVYKYVTIEGGDIKAPPGDPDVVLMEDGTYRLYFTSQIGSDSDPGIYYADGTDGLNFTYEGKAFFKEGEAIMDSITYFWQDEWFMLTLSGFSSDMVFAHSEDGMNFEYVKTASFKVDNAPFIASNEVLLEDGSVRMYAAFLGNGEIRSFLSWDGVEWTAEDGVALKLDETTGLEGYYLKDPAVVQLPDGTYLMAYVTRIPME